MNASVTHARILRPLIRSYQARGLDLASARGLARMDVGLGECECCRHVTGRATHLSAPRDPENSESETAASVR